VRWSGIVPPYRDTPIVNEAEDSSACQRSLAAGGRTYPVTSQNGREIPFTSGAWNGEGAPDQGFPDLQFSRGQGGT
jgi:hypothetical protein